MHVYAASPLSAILTVFLPVLLQCLVGWESIHQQLVLCVQYFPRVSQRKLGAQRCSRLDTSPCLLGPQIIAVVLPDHWVCSTDRMIRYFPDEAWKTQFE